MANLWKLWPLALALGCGACVSVGEPVLEPQSIAKGQRTILMVYPAPAPWVVTDSESKAEAAAKMLPVFSYAVSTFQEDRYKAAADTLNKYVPRWPARDLLEAALLKELSKTDFPGHFIPVAEADPDTATLRGWNRSTDVLDWQNRYLTPDPTLPHPRDYSRVMPWDDALAFEVNLLPMVAADDDGNMVPTLTATSRLFRCQTMHLLWKHEDTVAVSSGSRSLYEFETLPRQLVDRWQELVPALAAKISGSLYGGLHPTVSTGTASGLPATALSSGTASGFPAAAVPPSPALSSPTIATPTLPAISSGTISNAPPAVSTPTVTSPALPVVSTGTAAGPAIPVISTPTAAIPTGDGPPAAQPPPNPPPH
jgi:hypothetical protein